MRPLVLALAALLATCRPAPPPADLPPEDPAARAEALALLEAASPTTLEAAFDRLRGRPHGLLERLEQLDAAERVTAHRTRRRVVEGGTPRTLEAEQDGTFDFGLFGRFVSMDDLDRLPENPVPFVLADDPPPYLTPAGREAYAFGLAPDTTLGGRTVRVVTVTARPGEGDGQPLRAARLYVEAASGALVGVRLDRRVATPLYGEVSRLELLLRPDPSGDWLPERTVYAVALRAALTGTRRFRLIRQYGFEGAEPPEGGRLS